MCGFQSNELTCSCLACTSTCTLPRPDLELFFSMMLSRRPLGVEAVLASHRPLLVIFGYLDALSCAAFQATDFFLRADLRWFALRLRPVRDSAAQQQQQRKRPHSRSRSHRTHSGHHTPARGRALSPVSPTQVRPRSA